MIDMNSMEQAYFVQAEAALRNKDAAWLGEIMLDAFTNLTREQMQNIIPDLVEVARKDNI